jgi:hypothetical protein
MRRWALVSLFLIVIFAAPAIAQVQTVGDVSFAVPEGWAYQGAADGGYMMLKQGTNFWIVSVHPPRPTSGNPNVDFKTAWQKEVVPLPDFQRSLPGYDPYETGKMLLGYPGKYFDAFSDSGKMYARLYTLETGKMVVPITALTVNRQALDALQHIVEAVVSSVRLAPLKASPIRNTVSLADLVGEWNSGMANARMFYDRYTGAYAGSSTTAYSARYQVAGNGTFTYEMGGVWNGGQVQDKDTGTVQLGGDLIIFKGRNHETKYHFINFQTAIDGATVLTVIAGQEDPAKANITFSQQLLVREAKK